MTAAKMSSLRARVGSLIHSLTMRTASALYLRASSEVLIPRIRDRCAAAWAMTALKDAAFDRSKGNHTSRIGLNVAAGVSSNIMVAWVLSPGVRCIRRVPLQDRRGKKTHNDGGAGDAELSASPETRRMDPTGYRQAQCLLRREAGSESLLVKQPRRLLKPSAGLPAGCSPSRTGIGLAVAGE